MNINDVVTIIHQIILNTFVSKSAIPHGFFLSTREDPYLDFNLSVTAVNSSMISAT